MGMSQVLKEVGRGAAGSRALDRATARQAMGWVLDGVASELEIGAFLMALRMKGETLEELSGCLDAVQARLRRIPAATPVVCIASYNGARRLPNLTPLLALELARAGLSVLVHGPLHDASPTHAPARVTTADVLAALGLAPARELGDVQRAWARHEPAYVSTEWLCAPLQRLLDLRRVMGVRSIAHTLAKMIAPCTPGLRLLSYTHPEFASLMHAWASREGAHTMILRGTEGEPVADPRRMPRIDTVRDGIPQDAACVLAQEGSVMRLPLLPRGRDASSTAVYIQSVLAGERPLPEPLARQIAAVRAAMAAHRPSPWQEIGA